MRYAMMHPEDWEDRIDYWMSHEPEVPIPAWEGPTLTVEQRCSCGFPFAPWERACSQCKTPRPDEP